MAKASKGKAVVAWIGTIILAVMIFGPGMSKFSAASGWANRFDGWGLTSALVPFVGGAEVMGAFLLLVPKTATYGGIIISVVMIVATATHALNGEFARVPFTMTLAAIAVAIALYRRSVMIGMSKGTTSAAQHAG